jgi:hypothetical protein
MGLGTALSGRRASEALHVHASNLRLVFDAFSVDDLSMLDELLDRLRHVEIDSEPR